MCWLHHVLAFAGASGFCVAHATDVALPDDMKVHSHLPLGTSCLPEPQHPHFFWSFKCQRITRAWGPCSSFFYISQIRGVSLSILFPMRECAAGIWQLSATSEELSYEKEIWSVLRGLQGVEVGAWGKQVWPQSENVSPAERGAFRGDELPTTEVFKYQKDIQVHPLLSDLGYHQKHIRNLKRIDHQAPQLDSLLP